MAEALRSVVDLDAVKTACCVQQPCKIVSVTQQCGGNDHHARRQMRPDHQLKTLASC